MFCLNTSSHHTDTAGYEAMRKLLRVEPPPDGVFCYNDPVAAGAIKAVLEARLHVPDEIAIIGAGNVHYSDLLLIPLSTVDQSSSEIGEKAAELLASCIDAKTPFSPQRIFLPPRLVVRGSSQRRGTKANQESANSREIAVKSALRSESL